MCDPITIASLALTAGSVAANSAANASVARARTSALQAERQRQQSLDQEAAGINTKSQNLYQDFQGQQDAQAQKLGDYFTGQSAAAPPTESALPTSSSNIVVNEEAKQGAKAKAFTDKTGTALGNLRAFGDVLGSDSRAQARDAGLIGQINGFKTGSSAVLPYELDAASSAGNGMKTFGDVLQGLGSIGMSAGLSGKGLFGFGAKAPAVATGAPLSLVPNLNAETPRLGALY